MRWEPVQAMETRRLRLLGVFLFLLILAVLFRAFMFQVWKREKWINLVPPQYKQRVRLVAKRGIIYDRNMNILAMDLPILSLAIDPTQMKDRQVVASTLVKVLGGDEGTYRGLLERDGNDSFVRIRRDITENQKECLLDSEIQGLIFLKERKRIRSYRTMAVQVLGITNGEHRGVWGVEQSLDGILRGEDGWAIYQKDGLNRNFSCLDYPIERPRDGRHVVLTLDHVFQTVVEEELKKGVVHHKAKGGSAVLMDPFTGEILAMASAVRQRFGEEKTKFDEFMQNRAVQIDFEPGSTFKIVTAAAALEEGVFNPNSLVHCENGAYRLSNHTIHDHNKAYAWLTFRQILEQSSNIGIAKVGRKLGKKVLYKYTQDFGVGNRTSIGLPGEVAGILQPVYRWDDFSTAMISFGQGISVTTLQLACVVSAVADGGELVKPRILSAVLDETGKVEKTFSREIIRRVISERTAAQLTKILEGVVREGSGNEAMVEGIRIAGKTGTAQKSVPGFKGYFPGAYVSSFVGFWPVEAPMFVLVVVLDEPKEVYWGAGSAAPIFANVVARIAGLPTSPVFPDGRENKDREEKPFTFSRFEERDGSESSGEERISPTKGSPYHLPNLVGLSIREALQRLAVREVEVRVEGSGVVVKQEPEPGRKVESGMVCRLICREGRKDFVFQ